jgi:uncharacterized membrane protein
MWIHCKGASVAEDIPQTGLSDNAVSGLAYLTIIPAIIFLVLPPYNQSATVRFHAWQSIFLGITWFAIWVVLVAIGAIPVLNLIDLVLFPVLGIGGLILWIYLLLSALNGKRISLPILGPLAEKQAKL